MKPAVSAEWFGFLRPGKGTTNRLDPTRLASSHANALKMNGPSIRALHRSGERGARLPGKLRDCEGEPSWLLCQPIRSARLGQWIGRSKFEIGCWHIVSTAQHATCRSVPFFLGQID